MRIKVFIFFITFVSLCGAVNAQDWTKEDSLWLINVLEGKIDVKINEETKKAINDGRLIVPSWMKNDEGIINKIEISKDFSNEAVYDSTNIQGIDPYSMPPAVFALYVLYADRLDSMLNNRSVMLSDNDKNKLWDALPENVKYRFYYDGFSGGIGGLDFNHMLSMVFSPLYRQKVKNRKNAAIYRGDFYTREPNIRITERERKEMNKTINNFKVSSPVITHGQRKSGIDD